MALKNHLGLKKGFGHEGHELLLSIFYTGAWLRKSFTELLKPHGLTDVQLTLLMLLKHQSDADGGLSQADLSRMMLVNRANISALIDRAEKAGLVQRHPAAQDKRINRVMMTEQGARILSRVDGAYYQEIDRIAGVLPQNERRELVRSLDAIRSRLME